MLESTPGKFFLLRKEIPVVGNDDRLDALAGEDRKSAVDPLRSSAVRLNNSFLILSMSGSRLNNSQSGRIVRHGIIDRDCTQPNRVFRVRLSITADLASLLDAEGHR